MSPQERQQMIARYGQGYDEVASALEGLSETALSSRPLPEKWTAREIVHHLADSESISAQRLRKLLAEDKPIIHGYDQERYAMLLRYNERPLEPALEAFRAARTTTAQILAHMSQEDWEREGWHTESGRYTPETWLTIYAAHAHGHAVQIRRLRELLKT
ncbi:MAG: DUF664 domain-containing protein [Candidatus Eisenbacteria bacterium]|uniref:DUF664 domain-containing protein n=1 Tax=Eiseniibacteriota bacterium TaxID=2212470 RepID=A0A538U4T3_UNCEI|nr:MAG: DUF664 domain-containing protein [Candidatus Eisenbacteria bacterium]